MRDRMFEDEKQGMSDIMLYSGDWKLTERLIEHR